MIGRVAVDVSSLIGRLSIVQRENMFKSVHAILLALYD